MLRIPKPVRDGASMLERYLLNRGRVETALLVRAYRGIAVAGGDEEATAYYRDKYFKKMEHITKAPSKIIYTHIDDTSDFDTYWPKLEEFIDVLTGDIHERLQREAMEDRARNFLRAASVHTVMNMGFTAEGVWYYDSLGVEYFKFKDGHSVRWNDAVSYITYLKRFEEFVTWNTTK